MECKQKNEKASGYKFRMPKVIYPILRDFVGGG